MSNVASVTDGVVNISESSMNTDSAPSSTLDKDDFLMLLVTQMKYQDPLEPQSNTEYVAQLAQFSELEQMQNLNDTTINTSAYTLVGKQVYIEQSTETGGITEIQGIVEYVTLQNGDPYVSVNGELYSYEDIVQVIDEEYLISQYQPSVKKQTLTYLHHDPQNLQITGIDLGSNGYQASSMAVVLMDANGNTTGISSEYLSYKNGTLTVSKSALSKVPAGDYTVAIVFDDANSTVDYNSVSLTVKGSLPDTSSGDTEEESNSSTETEATQEQQTEEV